MKDKFILFCAILSITATILIGVLYTLHDLKQTKTYINKTMKAKYVNVNIRCKKLRGADDQNQALLILEKCIEE